MFESMRKAPALRDLPRFLLLPALVALVMDIPMEIDLYTRASLNYPVEPRFYWLYFHVVIVGVLSFGGPMWEVPKSTFLLKDETSWLMTVVNIAFYMLLIIWCRYTITNGFTASCDAADFRTYRPFKVACALLILGCLGLGGVALYGGFPPDEEAGLLFYVLGYFGLVLTLSSSAIVIGRRLRLKRLAIP